MTAIQRILNLARWAPSGDNTQPWRFQILDKNSFVVHGHDTRDHCVYDLDGHGSQIALGALLENIVIAASGEGLSVEFSRRDGMPETQPTYDVLLTPNHDAASDPLLPYMITRSVQRRSMSTTPLSRKQKKVLEASVGDMHSVKWFESFAGRLQMAGIMFSNAKIRLTIPEAYEVHSANIEWDASFSDDRVPDRAIGVDPVTLKIMRWVMGSWRRVDLFNTYLAGHFFPRIEMDLVPGIFCASHFIIVAREPAQGIDDYVAAGRAMQRFWLTVTSMGLHLQPEMTPLIFSRYVRAGRNFTSRPYATEQARALETRLTKIVGEQYMDRMVFAGRVGQSKPPKARSCRRSVMDLLLDSGSPK